MTVFISYNWGVRYEGSPDRSSLTQICFFVFSGSIFTPLITHHTDISSHQQPPNTEPGDLKWKLSDWNWNNFTLLTIRKIRQSLPPFKLQYSTTANVYIPWRDSGGCSMFIFQIISSHNGLNIPDLTLAVSQLQNWSLEDDNIFPRNHFIKL